MRLVALICDAAALVATGLLFAIKGPPTGAEVPVVVLLVAAPVLSIMALTGRSAPNGRGLIELWWHRLKLEQQARISTLRSGAEPAVRKVSE